MQCAANGDTEAAPQSANGQHTNSAAAPNDSEPAHALPDGAAGPAPHSASTPPPANARCPLTLGAAFTLERASERHRWYPYWALAACLLDTAEVLVEEFEEVGAAEAVEAEAHGLALFALETMAASPLGQYRCATLLLHERFSGANSAPRRVSVISGGGACASVRFSAFCTARRHRHATAWSHRHRDGQNNGMLQSAFNMAVK